MEKGGPMIPYMDPLWTVPVLWTNQMPPHAQQPTTTIQMDNLVTVHVTHHYLSQKSYPANFTKEDKHAFRK